MVFFVQHHLVAILYCADYNGTSSMYVYLVKTKKF